MKDDLRQVPDREGKGLTFSVVIPTKNRIEDLLFAVRSVLSQSRLPDELIVVDQSVSDEADKRTRSLLADYKSINYKHIFNNTLTGLTAAKNVAVKEAGSDIILFIDDDIVLDAEFLEVLEKVYRRYPELQGVGGVVRLPQHRQFFLRNLIAPIFQVGPFYDVRSLLQYGYKARAEVIPAPVLSGGLSSLKKEVFQRELFNEELYGASPIEDMDFFLRASRSFKFALATRAIALHNVSPVSRAGLRRAFERKTAGFIYIYSRYIPKTFLNLFCFFLKNTGILLDALVNSVLHLTWEPIIGVLSAWKIYPQAGSLFK